MKLKNNLETIIKHLRAKQYEVKVVYDIGANKGTWTAQHLPLMSSAQFILFEGSPAHKRPAKLPAKHKWINVVLSDLTTKKVDYYVRGGTGDSYYRENTSHYDNVKPTTLPAITLERAMKDDSLPLPDLIKFDTQGSELDIMRGGSKALEAAGIVVIETPILPYNKDAPSFDEYVNYLTCLDFVPVGVDGIHFSNSLLVQIDLVFLKSAMKKKYFGDNKIFRYEG